MEVTKRKRRRTGAAGAAGAAGPTAPEWLGDMTEEEVQASWPYEHPKESKAVARQDGDPELQDKIAQYLSGCRPVLNSDLRATFKNRSTLHAHGAFGEVKLRNESRFVNGRFMWVVVVEQVQVFYHGARLGTKLWRTIEEHAPQEAIFVEAIQTQGMWALAAKNGAVPVEHDPQALVKYLPHQDALSL